MSQKKGTKIQNVIIELELDMLPHKGTQLVSKSEQNANLVNRLYLVSKHANKGTQLVKNRQKCSNIIKV